jgi:hypothetical protein
MTNGDYVGSGDKFDVLNRSKYSIMKGLYEASKTLKKEINFGVVNFSNVTQFSGLDTLVKIYDTRLHPVNGVSLTPQCGGTQINANVFKTIETQLKRGKTIYTFISDGDIYGNTTSLYNEIDRFSSKKDCSFLYVDVGATTAFGKKIKDLSGRKPSVIYKKVSNIGQIKEQLSDVLIVYS